MLSGIEMEKSTWLPGLDQWFRATVSGQLVLHSAVPSIHPARLRSSCTARAHLTPSPLTCVVAPAQVTPDSIPAYYRGGHIIPRRERPRRSTVMQVHSLLCFCAAQ
jgi:hypothetical protein